MSSLFHINRQTETAKGSGLPFMYSLAYQERNAEVTDGTPLGYWQTPQNKLPTFQIWSDYDLTKIEIVPTDNGIDGTPFEILLTNVIKTCTDPAKKIYHTDNTELDFLLLCGYYYIKLTFGANPALYSEVFQVGGVCAFGFDLVVNGVQDMGGGIQRVSFSITSNDGSGTTTFYTEAVTNWTTQSALDNLPFGDTNVTTEITTQYCGVYTQRYVYSNLGGTTYTFIPVY